MAKIPFDIKYKPQIESGEYKVLTNDGSDVRIVCWDAEGSQRKDDIIALVKGSLGAENIQRYYVTGKLIADSGNKGNKDLVVVTPEPELTEFEHALETFLMNADASEQTYQEDVKKHAAELLSLAREQLIKDGYIIEKKAFHDVVEGAGENGEGIPIAIAQKYCGGYILTDVLSGGRKYIMLSDLEETSRF